MMYTYTVHVIARFQHSGFCESAKQLKYIHSVYIFICLNIYLPFCHRAECLNA